MIRADENGRPECRTIVIARNYQEFHHWCRENMINHLVPEVKFLQKEQDLYGVFEGQIIFAEYWQERRDAEEIYHCAYHLKKYSNGKLRLRNVDGTVDF